MNDRIIDLMNDANRTVGVNGNIVEMAKVQELMFKFAELIVCESMEVTKTFTSNQGLDYSAPVALARHFGVNK